jgi:hypothetical protein
MLFKDLRCPIPRFRKDKGGVVDKCDSHLVDIEANAPVTVRCVCKERHAEGHSNHVEFMQDKCGNVSFREIDPETDSKGYADNGVRFPMTEEEAQG